MSSIRTVQPMVGRRFSDAFVPRSADRPSGPAAERRVDDAGLERLAGDGPSRRATDVPGLEARWAPQVPARSHLSEPTLANWSPRPAREHAGAVEQYRKLAAQLIKAQEEHGVRSVLITSAVGAEGKSLTVANLAATLAQSYHRRTLIIDADQRAPRQHEIFNVANQRGLSEFFRGREDGVATTVRLHECLTLLPAGQASGDPMAGLTSDRLKELIAEAAAAFDFVIIDAPPATVVPDAGILAAMVDAVLLVIKAGSTLYPTIEQALAAVGRQRVLGTVLNYAEKAAVDRYPYGYGRR